MLLKEIVYPKDMFTIECSTIGQTQPTHSFNLIVLANAPKGWFRKSIIVKTDDGAYTDKEIFILGHIIGEKGD